MRNFLKSFFLGSLFIGILTHSFPCYALTFESPFNIRGRVKRPLSFQIKYSPTNVPTTFSAIGLPTNLTLNSSNGIISGTPLQKTTNLPVTITAIQTNATNSQDYTLTIKRRYPKPKITSRLFKSIEIKWDPYHAVHEIDGDYEIKASPTPTNLTVIFPVGKTGGNTNADIAWPEDWPEFKASKSEIDFHYRETKRRVPVGTFNIKLIAENQGGITTNILRLEITKKDE